jgi:hypothetical protein
MIERPKKRKLADEAPSTSYSIGRGNRTHGDERRGNKDGRPPMYPPGAALGRINLVIPMPLYTMLRVMGRGNATRGARSAVKLAAQVMPLWTQDETKVHAELFSKHDGKGNCGKIANEAVARLTRALRTFWDDSDLAEALKAPAERGAPRHISELYQPLFAQATYESAYVDDEPSAFDDVEDSGFTVEELKDIQEAKHMDTDD